MLTERYEDVLSAHFHFQPKKAKRSFPPSENIIWNHNPILRINLSVIYTILLLRNEKVNCEECEIRKKKCEMNFFICLRLYISQFCVTIKQILSFILFISKKKSNLIPNYRECVFTTKYTHRIQNRNPKSNNTILYMFWGFLEINGWLGYKI